MLKVASPILRRRQVSAAEAARRSVPSNQQRMAQGRVGAKKRSCIDRQEARRQRRVWPGTLASLHRYLCRLTAYEFSGNTGANAPVLPAATRG